jgi:hypothetical protein
MNLVSLVNPVYTALLVFGFVAALIALIVFISVEPYQKRAQKVSALLGIIAVIVGLVFTILFTIQHGQAITTLKSEAQRVYHITLVDEQAIDLLNDKAVQLNNGGRVELKQNADGTYKLVQPLAPRDYPVRGNLAQG